MSWDLGMKVTTGLLILCSAGWVTKYLCWVSLWRAAPRGMPQAFWCCSPDRLQHFWSSAVPGQAPVRSVLAPGDHGAQLNGQGADQLFHSRKGLKSWMSSHNHYSWGLFAIVAPHLGSQQKSDLGKLERKAWEAERLTGGKSKQTSINNTGCRSAL